MQHKRSRQTRYSRTNDDYLHDIRLQMIRMEANV
jgi:hypothetical protein